MPGDMSDYARGVTHGLCPKSTPYLHTIYNVWGNSLTATIADFTRQCGAKRY